MEFREFENPEQADYDVKTGANGGTIPSSNFDGLLDDDEGIDLNDSGIVDDLDQEERGKAREDYLRVSEEYEKALKLGDDEIEKNIHYTKQALETGWLPSVEYEQELREYLEILELVKKDRSLQPTNDYTLG